MYNDPNTGQFQWGNVIQDMIRNYMMMQMMNQGQGKTTETLGETPVPPPNIGGGINPPPNMQQQAPGSMGQIDPMMIQQLLQMLMGR